MRDLFPSADVDTTPAKPEGSGFRHPWKMQDVSSAAEAVADLEKRLGKRSAIWTYHDAEEHPVGVIVRWDKAGGKEIRPVAWVGGGWVQAGMPTPRPLYSLPLLLQSTGTVYVVEGEKAADALHSLGFMVTTSAHGAKSAKGSIGGLAGRRGDYSDNDRWCELRRVGHRHLKPVDADALHQNREPAAYPGAT